MISNVEYVRRKINSFRGEAFTVHDIECGKVPGISSIMIKMVNQGEVIRLGKVEVFGSKRSGRKTIYQYRAVPRELVDENGYNPFLVWRSVFPEFFTMPKIKGISRMVVQGYE